MEIELKLLINWNSKQESLEMLMLDLKVILELDPLKLDDAIDVIEKALSWVD